MEDEYKKALATIIGIILFSLLILNLILNGLKDI